MSFIDSGLFLYITFLIVILLIIFLFFELVLRHLTFKFIKKNKDKYVRTRTEFPKSTSLALEKFNSYDKKLGWEPKPVENLADTGHHRADKDDENKSEYSINSDGSRFQPKPETKPDGTLIEFFGNSAMFCRDVADDETFPYYLEKLHGIGPCKNYGVGSYGTDQAYLRACNKLTGNGIASLYIPLLSLYRLTSVYKHYPTPGNNWAVKPRFIIDENDNLKLIEKPFEDKNELTDLSNYAEFFRKNDNHYNDFKDYLLPTKGSYLGYYLKSKYALPELLEVISFGEINHLFKKFSIILLKFLVTFTKRNTYKNCKRSGISLIHYSKNEEGKILSLIARKFTDLAASRGSKAFIFISPQGYLMNYRSEYQKAVKNLRELFLMQGIDFYDLGEDFFSLENPQIKLFNFNKTHASPEGNRFIASCLAPKLKSIINDSETNILSTKSTQRS